jgi:hypothetical protein
MATPGIFPEMLTAEAIRHNNSQERVRANPQTAGNGIFGDGFDTLPHRKA